MIIINNIGARSLTEETENQPRLKSSIRNSVLPWSMWRHSQKEYFSMPSYIILCEATIRLLIFSYNVHWQWLCRKCTWFTGSSKWEYRIFSESVNGLFSLQENGYCYIVIHCFIQYCCMHTSLTNDAHGILHLHFKMFLFWSYLCSVFCSKASFKRRATAVLSWVDCSSTAARH